MIGHVVAFVGPLRPYVGVILPLFFVGFFFAAGVAIRYRNNTVIRRTYVVNFFVALVVVNLLLSVIPGAAVPLAQVLRRPRAGEVVPHHAHRRRGWL